MSGRTSRPSDDAELDAGNGACLRLRTRWCRRDRSAHRGSRRHHRRRATTALRRLGPPRPARRLHAAGVSTRVAQRPEEARRRRAQRPRAARPPRPTPQARAESHGDADLRGGRSSATPPRFVTMHLRDRSRTPSSSPAAFGRSMWPSRTHPHLRSGPRSRRDDDAVPGEVPCRTLLRKSSENLGIRTPACVDCTLHVRQSGMRIRWEDASSRVPEAGGRRAVWLVTVRLSNEGAGCGSLAKSRRRLASCSSSGQPGRFLSSWRLPRSAPGSPARRAHTSVHQIPRFARRVGGEGAAYRHRGANSVGRGLYGLIASAKEGYRWRRRTSPRAVAADDLVVRTVQQHADSLLRLARRHSLCTDDAYDAYQRGLEIFLKHASRLEPAPRINGCTLWSSARPGPSASSASACSAPRRPTSTASRRATARRRRIASSPSTTSPARPRRSSASSRRRCRRSG